MTHDRLHRLLGGRELDGLRMRLRARFERGDPRDAFTLNELNAAERRALEGLLGRAPKAANSMQLSHSELDRAIARAGIAADLRDALELLDGQITDRRAEQARQNQAWKSVLDTVLEPRLRALLEDPSGIALLKRCAGSDVTYAAILVERVSRVLQALPAMGVPRAQLAAETLGDSHGLDAGQPVAALALRACKVAPAVVDDADTSTDEAIDPGNAAVVNEKPEAVDGSTRAQWARLGVTVNELSAPVLCLNLPAAGGSPCGDMVRAAAHYGAPVYLTLRELLRQPPQWNVADTAVYVCENPSIVAAAADRLRTRCAPLVCTDGMPGAAQQALLEQLAATGAHLLYHGDFDWAGLRIANFVMREFGALPWRFGANDYLAIAPAAGPQLAAQRRSAAIWDAELADAMAAHGLGVHEERLMQSLLRDLDSSLQP